jgi:hypothetical protein
MGCCSRAMAHCNRFLGRCSPDMQHYNRGMGRSKRIRIVTSLQWLIATQQWPIATCILALKQVVWEQLACIYP